MTITSALILDLALLAVVIVTVIVAANRGFLATLVRLCGTALALFASWIAASRLSTAVFENFFRNGLVEKTAKMISEGGQTSIQSIIDKLAAFLPDSLVQSILGGTDKLQNLVDSNAPDVASQVVEQVIAPLFLPIISVVVFFVTFAITGVLLNFVISALTRVNDVPVLGGMNRLLGALAGLVLGVAYVLLLLCAVWAIVIVTGDGLTYFNTTTLEASRFYQFFFQYNPFL